MSNLDTQMNASTGGTIPRQAAIFVTGTNDMALFIDADLPKPLALRIDGEGMSLRLEDGRSVPMVMPGQATVAELRRHANVLCVCAGVESAVVLEARDV